MILHATLAAYRRGGVWRGLLVRGPSGSGKSSLVLRLMQQGWRLVADDRVIVWRSRQGLYGRAPDTLAGLIEARGVGVQKIPALPLVEILHVLDAADPGAMLERIPDPSRVVIDSVSLPHLTLDLHAPAAPAAVALWCGVGAV